jgi:hypothetical protein
MPVFLSPGVFTREIDLSLYIPSLSTTALGLVGVTTKGPINEPTYITNPVQFNSTFGDPANPSVEFQPSVYAALQYLHIGRQLWFVRVSEVDPAWDDSQDITEKYLAKYAKLSLSESSTAPVIAGTVNTLVTLSSSNNVMHFVIDGSGPGFDITFTLPGSGTVTKSLPEIVTLLNANTTFATYMRASLSLTGSLVITGTTSGASHSIQISGSSMSTNIFGFPKIGSTAYTPITYGTGNTTEKASVLGSGLAFPITIADGVNDDLSFSMGASEPVGVTSFVVPPGTYTTVSSLVAALNVISGFSTHLVASAFASVSGIGQVKVALKSTSSNTYLALASAGATDAAPFIFGGIVGDSFVVSNASTYPLVTSTGVNDTVSFSLGTFAAPTTLTITDTLAAGSIATAALIVDALNALPVFSSELTASVFTKGATDYVKVALKSGSTYDTLTLATGNGNAALFGTQPNQKKASTSVASTLAVSATSQGTWGNTVSIEIVNKSATTFDLNVYERGYQVEGYKNLVLTPETLPDPLAPGTDIANPLFVENAINGNSSRITVTNGVGNTTLPLPNPVGSRYLLTGGTNGGTTAVSNPSLYIGVASEVETTGLQFFRNPENLDINLIAVPGIADPAVINEMIDLCQTRGDCMAIVDPPNPTTADKVCATPQSMVTWVNGNNGEHQAFNSSYAAIYWPWLEIFDPVNKTTVYTPPSGHVAHVYAYTDYNTDPWIAPAGLTRGRLVTPTRAHYNPTAGERDLLYTNNVNPIATFVRDGINVYGQKTLQRKSSALDRVNVRRLMLYLEKIIASTARYILFEPNDTVTWISFVNLVEPYLQSVKDRRGLIDFQVRCDATTNTADVVDRSEMRAIIFLKPTKAAEFIQIDFVLTSQGANFSELTF